MTQSKLNYEQTFYFIELYKREPCIWDPKNKYHRDKMKITDAWRRISAFIGFPVSELKKKKETLMSAFRFHFKKEKASIISGCSEDVYKPVWMFYDVMKSFLGSIYDCSSQINAKNELQQSEETVEIECDEESMAAGSSAIDKQQQNIRKIRKRRSALKNANKRMKEVFNTLNNVLNRQLVEEDDCDLYGRLLAQKLRPFTPLERQEIMHEIDGLLIKRNRSRLNQPSNSYTTPSPPLNSPSQISDSHSS